MLWGLLLFDFYTWFKRAKLLFVNSFWFNLFIAAGIGTFGAFYPSLVEAGGLIYFVTRFVASAAIGGSVVFAARLYVKLGNTVPTISELQYLLDDLRRVEDRLLPGLYITKTMKYFHDSWTEWKIELPLSKDYEGLEKAAWNLLADEYFFEENRKIKARYISTNSNRYTSLISEATEYLGGHLDLPQTAGNKISNTNIIRYHITGMLPEEFYNAPQVEFTSKDSQPIFFCHKWEDYNDFYSKGYKGVDENILVERCTIVRRSKFPCDDFSALSTLADLKEQSTLSILDRNRSVNSQLISEIEECKRRLFRKYSLDNAKEYNEIIESILGKIRYNYYPIISTEECTSRYPEDPYEELLQHYSNDFHGGQSSNARYCTLDEASKGIIDAYPILGECFKPGWIPEIVLFGNQSIEKDTREWYFGILGHWRPFTAHIELRFLTALQTNELYNAFISQLYNQMSDKGTLLSLM